MKKQVPLPFCDGFLRVRSTTNKETKMLLTCKIAHYIIPLRGGGRRTKQLWEEEVTKSILFTSHDFSQPARSAMCEVVHS